MYVSSSSRLVFDRSLIHALEVVLRVAGFDTRQNEQLPSIELNITTEWRTFGTIVAQRRRCGPRRSIGYILTDL